MGHNGCNLNGLLSCTTFTFIDLRDSLHFFHNIKKKSLLFTKRRKTRPTEVC